jgi:hypothetical protein
VSHYLSLYPYVIGAGCLIGIWQVVGTINSNETRLKVYCSPVLFSGASYVFLFLFIQVYCPYATV